MSIESASVNFGTLRRHHIMPNASIVNYCLLYNFSKQKSNNNTKILAMEYVIGQPCMMTDYIHLKEE